MKLKTLIIDDEKPIRTSLNIYLSDRDDIEVVGEAGTLEEAVAQIAKCQPDLVFLDIQLKQFTGFDMLDQLPDLNFKLIFVTAYSEYAIKAFKYSAFDYLLKPIDPDMLYETIDRLKVEMNTTAQQYKALKGNTDFQKITIKTTENIYHISFEDIVYCKADGSYTHFYLNTGKTILSSKPLKQYQNILPENLFFRSHQSYLVNVKLINGFDKKNGVLLMQNNEQIPVSVRNRPKVQQLF